MIVLVLIFLAIGLVIAAVAFLAYRKVLRRAKGIERGLKMVPILIHLPPTQGDDGGNRDSREVMREKVAHAEALYDLIAGTAQSGFKSRFYGQRHIALELVASGGVIHYYAAVPVVMVSVVEQAILTAYPGARLEETEDHNLFNPEAKLAGTSGGELALKKESAYPIATIEQLERDPMEALINALSTLMTGEGAAVQILLRPAGSKWMKAAARLARKKRHLGDSSLNITPMALAKAAVKAPTDPNKQPTQLTGIEQTMVDGVEKKAQHVGYEVLIRMVTSAPTVSRSQAILRDIVAVFALFDAPGSNGFKFLPAAELSGLVTAFVFRFFPPELNRDILNSQELAGLFHLPDTHMTVSSQVERQASKQVDGPPALPTEGLLLGYNEFRGTRKEIHLAPDDRRRHTYIVGQTGTGKSVLLENLAVQDMLSGNGFAFIDPHGDTAEKLISMVPKNRTEDVIYFNPGDTEYPLGLNLFEFNTPEQKDFLVQEAINMMYKIYDPQKQGIIGPRFEQWFRNAALTLMSDPSGGTFIEVPKVFTDAEFLKAKFKYLTDPTVMEFWTKEMGQTSDFHKSEMLGWFASKFGAFQQNTIMRNIMGQVKSAFNLREIMDQKKILIVNLSKGLIGDLNSQYLGMIFVIKFQAAAMSRAGVDPSQRPDFCLYVDEFQNFSTDSFASILSEARKYGLNLIVANQFIGQLTPEIRDAVFGNVGSVISFRTGPEDAEFLVKQFAPSFDAHDLVNLPIGQAATKLLIAGLPSQPFSLATLPPLNMANPELGLAVKQLSAAKFGATKAQVEAEIFGRLQVGAKPAASTLPPTAPTATSVPGAAAVRPSDGAPLNPVPAQPSTPLAPTPIPTVVSVPEPAPAPVDVVVPASVPPAAQTVQPATEQPPVAQVPPAAPTMAVPTLDSSNPSPVSTVSSPVIKPAENALSIADITKNMPAPTSNTPSAVQAPQLKPSSTPVTNPIENQLSARVANSPALPLQNLEADLPGANSVDQELAAEIKSAGLDSVIKMVDPVATSVSAVVPAEEAKPPITPVPQSPAIQPVPAEPSIHTQPPVMSTPRSSAPDMPVASPTAQQLAPTSSVNPVTPIENSSQARPKVPELVKPQPMMNAENALEKAPIKTEATEVKKEAKSPEPPRHHQAPRHHSVVTKHAAHRLPQHHRAKSPEKADTAVKPEVLKPESEPTPQPQPKAYENVINAESVSQPSASVITTGPTPQPIKPEAAVTAVQPPLKAAVFKPEAESKVEPQQGTKVEVKPVSVTTAEPLAVSASTKPGVPPIPPGEIFVDADGNVHMGE